MNVMQIITFRIRLERDPLKNKTIESNYNIYYDKSEKWFKNLTGMYR